MAEFFLQNVIRGRPLPPYFCHGCSHRFGSSSDTTSSDSGDPVCPQCGSDFVERVEQEEQHTTGGRDPNTPRATTTSTITISRPRERITIETQELLPPGQRAPTEESTPVQEQTPMEQRMSMEESAAPVDHRLPMEETSPMEQRVPIEEQTPMEETADDPEPELIEPEAPRRRTVPSTSSSTTSTTSSSSSMSSIPRLPGGGMGGPYVRIRGPRGQPLAQMIYQHIENLMNPQRAREHPSEEEADGDGSLPPTRRPRQSDSPPPSAGGEEGESEENSGADLHFAVGLPWYLMLHGRDHARRVPSHGAQARGQSRPQNPQLPRFGVPLVIGFNSGPVHGSPGDYAWGPSGLDDIITQMLANLEDNGPPPAKEEKIAELPKLVATKEDLVLCAECSVCKEQFTVGEELLKLPCSHLYHNDCVIPWLKLHDTCPTCRYHLNTGKYEPDQETA